MSRAEKISPTGRAAAILYWWHASCSGLTRLRDEIRSTGEPPDELDAVLLGKTDIDLAIWFREQVAETDVLARFALLSAVEGLFMTSFDVRCSARLKDDLSVAFRALAAKARASKRRVDLHPDVLDAWARALPEAKGAVGLLRGHFKYRHWVAHGRYWSQNLARDPVSPQDLADALAKVMTKLGLTGWR